MYTLDTNAIIYYLKDDPHAIPVLQNILDQAAPIYSASITEVELFGFPRLTEDEAEQIESLLETVSSIPLSSRIARIAGTLRRHHGLKVVDSIIAATALFTGTTLITRNVRDFRNAQNLTVLKI